MRELHRQTRATSIPAAVKQVVWERDCGRCVLCGRPGNPWCHYISRAQGGLGIAENILTLCPVCHLEYDGTERNNLRPILRRYLREHYDDWNEDALTYKK